MRSTDVTGSIDHCVMCDGADPSVCTPMQRLLPLGASRFIAQTPRLAAIPTFGSFAAGYVLILPRVHVTSFGCLDKGTLQEADELVASLADRMASVYGGPVLGFEAGNNLPGTRRIEHAHWHLLPSSADLTAWLDERLPGKPIDSLADLPTRQDVSYLAVRSQRGELRVYAAPEPPEPRIRLRRLVAQLDPQIDAAHWDWADHRYAELIRQTVADLGSTAIARPR